MSTLAHRLFGSVRLDAQSYEEVEADRSATTQAIAVVLISSLAAVIGAGIRDVELMVVILTFVVVTWFLWVLLALMIGTVWLPKRETQTDFGQILRTTGFSSAPGILRIFGVIPVIGWYIYWGAMIWMLFSFVVAIRQAMDFTSTGRALAVSFLGWTINGVFFFGFVLTAN